MSLAILYSRALQGGGAPAVRVETFLGGGLPSFQVVGLADTEVRESRERVRAALQSSGFDFPAGRLVVSLAPADLPKESGRFDLPIALGVLLASGQIKQARGHAQPPSGASTLRRMVFAGELSLTGVLIPVHAPLSIALGVRADHPDATLVLPHDSALTAACVPDITVLGARSLADVVAHLEGRQALPLLRTTVPTDAHAVPCLSDVRGQASAHQAVCLAAAGGHSVLMQGWPGMGKSMLAQRLPGVLPPLTPLESLETRARFERADVLPPPVGCPPFRSPHHSMSVAALIGGGLRPQPGEISLAHQGVLFLDELPEFKRSVLESLREPLETGWVAISRLAGRRRFPAKCLLVAAMNPCPCGWHGHPRRPCICSPAAVARYRARVSGPLLDRIDLQVTLEQPDADGLDAPQGEPSCSVRTRVAAARQRQLARQGCLNADLEPARIADLEIDADARGLLRAVVRQNDWSARAVHRVLRVARTAADLAARDRIAQRDVAQAVHLRQDIRQCAHNRE